jgi:hypothetical protein
VSLAGERRCAAWLATRTRRTFEEQRGHAQYNTNRTFKESPTRAAGRPGKKRAEPRRLSGRSREISVCRAIAIARIPEHRAGNEELGWCG